MITYFCKNCGKEVGWEDGFRATYCSEECYKEDKK